MAPVIVLAPVVGLVNQASFSCTTNAPYRPILPVASPPKSLNCAASIDTLSA